MWCLTKIIWRADAFLPRRFGLAVKTICDTQSCINVTLPKRAFHACSNSRALKRRALTSITQEKPNKVYILPQFLKFPYYFNWFEAT